MSYAGKLKVIVYDGDGFNPYVGAKVTLTPEEFQYNYYGTKEVFTGESGETEVLEVPTPPTALSQSPSYNSGLVPYSSWSLKIEAPQRIPISIKGVQVFPEITSIQKVNLQKDITTVAMFRTIKNINDTSKISSSIIEIGPHVLYGNYTKKSLEEEEKEMPKSKSMFRVLPEVIIPDKIVVHVGTPNSAGPNYEVNFKEYIKNVASSEIYPTWSENTIRANIHCIVSFTLNRIFTEWYRAKGKNFDITNSTAYDHYFVYGRNIFENIGNIVDEVFAQYIKRQGAIQPLLAQYCDGIRSKCPGHLTQWGSKYLGDEGKTPYEILTHFYGNNIVFDLSKIMRGVPKSYPGNTLVVGSRGKDVTTVQKYINRISRNFPAIKKLSTDGIYGNNTRQSVQMFQKIFGLNQDGNVDYKTWYKLSDVYVAVTKMAEASGEGERESELQPSYPGNILNIGSKGNDVKLIQEYLNVIRTRYPSIIYLVPDGIYGYNSSSAVSEFQRNIGIPITGKVDGVTWNSIVNSYNSIKSGSN